VDYQVEIDDRFKTVDGYHSIYRLFL